MALRHTVGCAKPLAVASTNERQETCQPRKAPFVGLSSRSSPFLVECLSSAFPSFGSWESVLTENNALGPPSPALGAGPVTPRRSGVDQPLHPKPTSLHQPTSLFEELPLVRPVLGAKLRRGAARRRHRLLLQRPDRRLLLRHGPAVLSIVVHHGMRPQRLQRRPIRSLHRPVDLQRLLQDWPGP